MVLLGLVLTGIGFYIRYSRTKPRVAIGLGEMKLKNYIIIGIAQGIAALPGGEQVRDDCLSNADHGRETRTGLQTILSRLHSRLTGSILRHAYPKQVSCRHCNSSSPAYRHSHRGFDRGRGGIFVISYLLKFAKTSRVYVIDFARSNRTSHRTHCRHPRT